MIADNFFDDKIVRVTIKNNFMYLYMLTCVQKYLIIHFRQKKSVSPPSPPPPPPLNTHFLILYHGPSAVVNTVIFFATCIQWYGTPILWGYNACTLRTNSLGYDACT